MIETKLISSKTSTFHQNYESKYITNVMSRPNVIAEKAASKQDS